MSKKNYIIKLMTGILLVASFTTFTPVLANADTVALPLPLSTTVSPSKTLLKEERNSEDKVRFERAKIQLENDLKRAQALKDRTAKQRCEKAVSRVSELTSKISLIKEKRANYTKLITKFTNLSRLLKEKGQDTTQLDIDIAQLKTLLAKRLNHESLAIDALKKTEDIQCTDRLQEDKNFKKNFDIAKERIKELNKAVRTEKQEIDVLLRKIRQNLLVLKSELVTNLERERRQGIPPGEKE